MSTTSHEPRRAAGAGPAAAGRVAEEVRRSRAAPGRPSGPQGLRGGRRPGAPPHDEQRPEPKNVQTFFGIYSS